MGYGTGIYMEQGAQKMHVDDAHGGRIDFEGTDGTGNMIYTNDAAATTAAGSIQILVNGVAKYIRFYAAEN